MLKPADPRNGGWKEFCRCWPWLEESIEWFGHTSEKHHVWDNIHSRKHHFWPGKDCAIITKIITYPTGVRLGAFWLAGGDLSELVVMESEIIPWFKKQGCDKVSILGRKGWERRLPGYKQVGVRLVKDI